MSDIRAIYTELGIDTRNLGCAMLGVDIPDLAIAEEDLFESDDPHTGGVPEFKHVTLRYGLFAGVTEAHVNEVLSDIGPPPLELFVVGLSAFQFPEYDVVKAGVDSASNPWLYSAYKQLDMLPGVNAFPEYTPHITLAYTKKGWWNNANHTFPSGYVYTREVAYSPAEDLTPTD